MRVGFMGTSVFAVYALEKLLESAHEVVWIVTQPDRPNGRGKTVKFTPVKETALQKGYEVFQPLKIRETEAVERITAAPLDVIVVAAYGQIIPQAILDFPRYGCINIHGSLLPEYRGAAPIQRAILDGKKQTGVTIMHMDAGLDTGDMILSVPMDIGEDENHGELEARMAQLGADALLRVLEQIEDGSAVRTGQEDALATYAARLTREEERIDWNAPAEKIHGQVRAFAPEIGVYTLWNGKRFKIYATHILPGEGEGTPGEVLSLTPHGFSVQTGRGILEVQSVQKEGKSRMAATDFTRGVKDWVGTVLG